MSGSGIIFEWDEQKRCSNLRKHGLDFEYCAEVFSGPTITRIDARFDYGETRYMTLGLLRGRAVGITHTETEECIRVISFRKASKDEQTYYFQTIKN